MIGVKPKKKQHNDDNLPLEGQARIVGYVSERNIFTGNIANAVNASVSLFKDGVLVGQVFTGVDGTYIIDAIDAANGYSLEIIKDSSEVIPEFTLVSRQIKEIQTQLTTDNFS